MVNINSRTWRSALEWWQMRRSRDEKVQMQRVALCRLGELSGKRRVGAYTASDSSCQQPGCRLLSLSSLACLCPVLRLREAPR